MEIADIVCFEHEWRDIANLSWASNYPGWRFMGISSNEFVKVMGYNVGTNTAQDDLEEARSLNIAYHYSADHYIWLPPWLDIYGGFTFGMHPVSEYDHLDLSAVARPAEISSAEEMKADSSNVETEIKEKSDDEIPDGNKNKEEKTGRLADEPTSEGSGKEQSDDDSQRLNEPPSARAGEDQTILLESETPTTVFLEGKGTDPDSDDGEGLAFEWQQTDGPEVSLIEADSRSARFALEPSLLDGMTEAQLRFKLTVTDTDGSVDADSLNVLVAIEETEPRSTKDDDPSVGNKTDTQQPTQVDQDSDQGNNQTTSSVPNSNSTKSLDEKDLPVRDELSANNTGASEE
jgi:hypothetical protein